MAAPSNNRIPCILVGVTGGIAAYKSCELVRCFQRAGCRVKVVMTEHATHFVGPTTFRSLTKEPVAIDLFDAPGDPIHHVSLSQECDMFVIAPATANILAKMAHGLADDLLSTTALAFDGPIVVAPAMNTVMYENEATQDNMETLAKRGIFFVEADEGYLACGDSGKGRMAEPQDIADAALKILATWDDEDTEGAYIPQVADDVMPIGDLTGKSVFVTAGPTVEPIDPVRFISNHSSGKMGYAIAEAAARRGAEVIIVSGPVHMKASEGIAVIPVQTACEMLEASVEPFADADIAVFTAAVADVRPASAAAFKLKKGSDDDALSELHLVQNPDIIATLAADKKPGQIVIGFAAETNDVVANAQKKLKTKHADMIVANSVAEGAVFGSDMNTAIFVTDDGIQPFEPMTKAALAEEILNAALAML